MIVSPVKDVKGKDVNVGSLRNAGIANATGNKAERMAAEDKRVLNDPPPLVHMDPTTGIQLSEPLPISKEANINTIPVVGGPATVPHRRSTDPKPTVKR